MSASDIPADVMDVARATREQVRNLLMGGDASLLDAVDQLIAHAIFVERERPRASDPMWGEVSGGGVRGFMCKVAFEYELGGALGGNLVHPDAEGVLSGCGRECGVVEVEVRRVREVHPAKPRHGEHE